MFSRVFSGWYCWNILICLLLDTILELLRLLSKLVSPTALQALACFLVHILAAFATFSSGGAKTEKLYNDFNFLSLKEAFCGIEWTSKNLSFVFLLRTFLYQENTPKLSNNKHFCKKIIQGVFSWFFRNCNYQSSEICFVLH